MKRRRGSGPVWLPPVCWAIACLPLWRWWLERFGAGEEIVTTLLAWGTALALTLRNARTPAPRCRAPAGADVGQGLAGWLVASAAMLIFALSADLWPMTMRGAAALTALLFLPGPWRRGRLPDPAVTGLLALSLPATMILDLVCGYPLRLAATWLAGGLLGGAGLPVARQGVELTWHGHVVWVDAPCAGIRMLWSGGWLVCAAAGLLRLNWGRTLLAAAAGLLLVLLANAARVALLCLAAAGLLPAGEGMHAASGAACALLGGLGVALVTQRLARTGTREDTMPAAAAAVPAPGPVGVAVGAKLFLAACFLAIALGLAARASGPARPAAPAAAAFPGWPAEFEGRPLRETALTPREAAFNAAFPGRMGRFESGQRVVLLRWVTRPTHRVHSAADCLRAVGWRITAAPLQEIPGQRRWSAFVAQRGAARLRVRERCSAADGGHWPDVSAWFWSALLGRSRGPWWIVTVVEGA